MSAIELIITDAGRSALINAQNSGTNNLVLESVGLGTGTNTSTGTQTELQNEFKRLTTVSGLVLNEDLIHLTVRDDSNDAYEFSEFGIYTDQDLLFAVYSAPTSIMEKKTGAPLNLAIDFAVTSLDTGSIQFGDAVFSNPPATPTNKGVIEVADQDEALAAEDTERAMTPATSKALIDQEAAIIKKQIRFNNYFAMQN